MVEPRYTFTVFTATFNRAHTLSRVYEALKGQTFRDFEWLIVDDGSTDGTGELVAGWLHESDFPIRYVWQPRGGKARATNRGVEGARGRFFLPLDSDDVGLPQALERFKHYWDSIPEGERHLYSAVTCLMQDESGKICGNPFPFPVVDSDSLEMRDRYQSTGERWGFHRTDVLRQFPFPEIDGETFITEGVVWTRIALSFKTRYVNDVLGVYFRESDSIRGTGARVKNPRGAALYYRQLANTNYPLSNRFRLRSYVNYVRYSFHAKVGAGVQLREVRSAIRWWLALPVGVLLVLRDRVLGMLTPAQAALGSSGPAAPTRGSPASELDRS